MIAIYFYPHDLPMIFPWSFHRACHLPLSLSLLFVPWHQSMIRPPPPARGKHIAGVFALKPKKPITGTNHNFVCLYSICIYIYIHIYIYTYVSYYDIHIVISYHVLCYRILLYHIILYHIISYHITLHYITLYYIILYCIILYYIVLYCIILYIVLYHNIYIYTSSSPHEKLVSFPMSAKVPRTSVTLAACAVAFSAAACASRNWWGNWVVKAFCREHVDHKRVPRCSQATVAYCGIELYPAGWPFEPYGTCE